MGCIMTNVQCVPVYRGTIGNLACLTVDGRSLHDALGVRSEFSNWMRGRIAKYGFVEGRDFSLALKYGDKPEGGRPSREYTLTLSMAKELCMVENSENGRLTRRYFIECEHKARGEAPPQAAQPAAPPAESVIEGLSLDARRDIEPHTRAIAAILGTLRHNLSGEVRDLSFRGLYDGEKHALCIHAMNAMRHHHEAVEHSLDALLDCGRVIAAVKRLHE